MRIMVTGSSGLIGSSLVHTLLKTNHNVIRLIRTRQPNTTNTAFWNPATGDIDVLSMEGLDAVVHLAGENVASGRWTRAKMQRMHDSRVKATYLLCKTLAGLANPPETLVSASATGYYGDCGDEILDENAPPGEGLLADVCKQWEAATQAARNKGIRVIVLRIGVVMTPIGGALAKMLPAFKLGLGGKLGDGRQYMSWLSLDDMVRIIRFALENTVITGSVNAVSPQPVTNTEFTRTLGRILRRPTFMSIPAPLLRLVAGRMADEMLLISNRVAPTKLLQHGFEFRHPDLEITLREMLDRK